MYLPIIIYILKSYLGWHPQRRNEAVRECHDAADQQGAMPVPSRTFEERIVSKVSGRAVSPETVDDDSYIKLIQGAAIVFCSEGMAFNGRKAPTRHPSMARASNWEAMLCFAE